MHSALKVFLVCSVLASNATVIGANANEKNRKVSNKPKQTLPNPFEKQPTVSKPSGPIDPRPKTPTVTRPGTGKYEMAQPAKRKQYRIPGSVALSTATRHGYRFSTRGRGEIDGCQFNGSFWTIGPKQLCTVSGFKSNTEKCHKLRKGWKVVDLKFHGWHEVEGFQRFPYDSLIEFDVFATNYGKKVTKNKVVQIKQLVLEGPDGPFNSFEKAFSHCSDPGYRN